MPIAPPDVTTTERPWHRTHLVVPRADESLLTIPSIDDTAGVARANAELLDGSDVDVQGRSLARLRGESRREALRLGRIFTRDVLSDRLPQDDPAAIVVSGHQPTLYHPGVWAKNFAAGAVANRLNGTVLNLVVDNDIYARPAIDVPAGTRAEPRREAIAFDAPARPRPWEQARVVDAETFRTFGSRTAAHMRRWNLEPVVEQAWPSAESRFDAGGTLAECLTAARHSLEAAWGLHHLELPMSRLCSTDSFLWVAAHILAQLPRFAEIYNLTLGEYRRIYCIKSKNHPVPILERRDEWLEAPFWVWQDDTPHRRRVFARQFGKQIDLADDSGRQFAALPLSPTMDACCAVDVLRTLSSSGVRFRTRALTTTLFARLFVADTFIHGIGGAKYDEMTDRIIARFFGVAVPGFATVSASLFLPFAEPFDATDDDERRLLALLRDLEQNPQRHITYGMDGRADRLLTEKAALIAEQDAASARTGLSRRERRMRSAANEKRFKRLNEVTAELAEFTKQQRAEVLEELNGVRRARRANAILTNREFSFVLYPESKLRPFMTGIAAS